VELTRILARGLFVHPADGSAPLAVVELTDPVVAALPVDVVDPAVADESSVIVSFPPPAYTVTLEYCPA